MNSVEVDERINLKEIVDISEDDFKKQISAWIDERGISRKLQSKLRADLFEQFNRTKLGRQMSEQHQQAHRIVLSPLILVLNTLVAEFLYAEDCHFTLSVFANEVPYKNTLPDFESTPPKQPFRFSESELNDIFEAIGISTQNEQIVRDFYVKLGSGGQDALNKSLLYCIVKTLITQIDSGRSEKTVRKPENKNKNKTKTTKTKASKPNAVIASSSSQQTLNSSPHSNPKYTSHDSSRPKYERFNISSRYFKYLNRYLDILSDRVNDMSKSLAEKRSGKKSHRSTVDSSTQEESIKKDLRKIVENINKLTKSQHKSKRFQDVLNSIERLSVSVEKCGGKLGDLLNMVNLQTKNESTEKELNDKKADPFGNMDYGSWLKELKTSENGKKFIDRLEISLQKTMEKERENLEKLYEERMNNYRMLIRLHYKQKYETNKGECEKRVDNTVEKENSSPIDRFTPDDMEKVLAESLAARALEKEQQVDNIVQTAKNRLQQLERESEVLDQSFQAYLRRQQILKQQMNDDASKIWENYSLSKAALSQFDAIENKHTNAFTFGSKLNIAKMDPVVNSTFNDDVDIQEVLRDLNEIKQLKSPRINTKEAFINSTIFPQKYQENTINSMVFKTKSPEKRNLLPVYRVSLDDNRISLPDNKVVFRNEKLEMPKKQIESVRPKTKESVFSEELKVHMSAQATAKSTLQNQTENLTLNAVEEIKFLQREADIDPLGGLINGERRANNQLNEVNLTIDSKDSENSTKLNGNTIQKNGNVDIAKKLNGKKEDEKSKLNKEENEVPSTTNSMKFNGFNISEEISEKPIENGLKNSLTSMANGFGSKKMSFVSKISESDSNEIDSDQISIGPQRVKSPDDFWI